MIYIVAVAAIFIIAFFVKSKFEKNTTMTAENDDDEFTQSEDEFMLSDDEFELSDEDLEDEEEELSASDKKRLEQLDNMLKNGIIDRTEYKLMLKRYGLD